MRSVPPRGSGWVSAINHSSLGPIRSDRDGSIPVSGRIVPTRYRVGTDLSIGQLNLADNSD
jgi:hypothetical protein